MSKTEKAKKRVSKKEPVKSTRSYLTNVREKIEAGKPWKFLLIVDKDNAENILSEIENSSTGGEYSKVMNSAIRSHYKNKNK